MEDTKRNPDPSPPHPVPASHHLPKPVREVRLITHKARHWIRGVLAGMGLSTGGGIFLVVAVIVLVLRFYGLPSQVKSVLLAELESRGVVASVDRVLLDPSGAFLLDNVSVYRTKAKQDLLLSVDQVRLGIAWFSWWRGQPLLQDATVHNATIHFPLTEHSTIDFSRVNAAVDFRPDGLMVRGIQTQVLNMIVDLRGTVLLNGPLPKPKRAIDPEAARRIDDAWRRIRAASYDFDTEHPAHLHVDFNVATATPDLASVRARFMAHTFRWRGALIDEISANATMENRIATLNELRVRLARGELNITGEADLVAEKGHADFYSNADFTSLAEALPGRLGDVVGRLRFGDLPVLSGEVDGSWGKTPTLDLQADLDWEAFSYGAAEFDRLVIPVAFDGKRVFVPEAELTAKNGSLKLDLLYDRANPDVRAKVASTLDFTVFEGVFGSGVDKFLQSLHFNGSGPTGTLTVTGTSNDPRQWKIEGKGTVVDFSYKNIPFLSAESAFTFQDSAIEMKDFVVRRKEGNVTGTVKEDFAARNVKLTNLAAEVNLQEVAPALGDKFASYVAPYAFDRPPRAKVEGLVDLNDQKDHLDTDLTIDIDATNGPVLHYVLMKIPLEIARPKAQIRIIDRTLSLKCPEAQVFDGGLTGKLQVQLDQNPAFQAAFTVNRGDFHKAMVTITKNEQATGTFDFQLETSGLLGDLSTFQGAGSLGVDDGYIMSIPFLGGLSAVIGAVIPGFGQSKADHGKCTFKIVNGVLNTDDVTISSLTFNVIGNGKADFVHDALDFDVRINVRGIMGLLLFPVSKLFSYHGSGPLEKPVWSSKNL